MNMNYNVNTTIHDYLFDIYQRFKYMCDNKENLCELKNVNFENGSLPDYSDELISLLYCLRYHYGYAFEYEEMYRYIIDDFKCRNKISVLSVGCGNGIDLWSLNRAVCSKNIKRIEYTGIDCVDWCDSFCIELPNSAEYYTCDLRKAGLVIDNLDDLDILIFPKSISELTIEDLHYLVKRIENITDEFYVLSSLRKNDYNRKEDMSKIEKMSNWLHGYGFKTMNVDAMNCLVWDCDEGIRAASYDYVYPDDALNYLTHLQDYCFDYDEDNFVCSTSCHNKLTRMPILKTNTICCNCIKFERE